MILKKFLKGGNIMNIAKKVARQELKKEAIVRRAVARDLRKNFKANTRNEYKFKIERNVSKYFIEGEGMRLECSMSSYTTDQLVNATVKVLIKFGFCIESQVPYKDQFSIISGVVIRAYLPK